MPCSRHGYPIRTTRSTGTGRHDLGSAGLPHCGSRPQRAVLAPSLGAVVWLAVPKWGGMLQDRVVRRLYSKEGNVALPAPGERKKVWALMLGGSFGTCIVASVVMSFVLDIPIMYMQPISALYVVPFLVGLWFLMRPLAGYPALLWPVLYAIHAMLIVAGRRSISRAHGKC